MKQCIVKWQLLAIIILTCASQSFGAGFLKVSGTKIVDGNGNEIILRGMGLGGWQLPEGYMLQMSSFANAPWEIKKKVADVVGAQNADTFWIAYRKNFVQRKDIERLAQLGFNSIRMVMHWEFYLNVDGTTRSEGFLMTDSLLRWCSDNKIYMILDLHAAPGGQSANNISDYDPAYPSLWQNEDNKQGTILLWKKLAEHYQNEPWIGGYDILNEPAWDLPPTNKPLRDLSVAITNAIRSVDTTHIIFVEGNWFATDFSGMAPAWDNNMVWSFHKYWNTNDIGSINYLLTLRNSTNRPLWLGESGENSNSWFTDCITLLEANKIGWSWWTLKKFSTINGPFSIPINTEYDYLLRYWKGQATKPTVDYAMKGLMGMAEGLKLENCVYNSGVIDAMFRQPYDDSRKPFAPNTVPGKIFLVNYDYGKNGFAYKDILYTNTDNNTVCNNGWLYRNDGVDIEKCTDAITNGYNVGWIESAEFLTYTVDVQQSGNYSITLRAAVNAAGGYVGISWDGKDQVIVPLSMTGGWQTWGNIPLGTVDLTAGKHLLKLTMYFGGFNLNYVDLAYAGPSIVSTASELPDQFSLQQNFPNPFNPVTNIQYQIPERGHVTLRVFDLLGKEIALLIDEVKEPGRYSIPFGGKELPSGMYYYSLTAGPFTSVKKMLLLK